MFGLAEFYQEHTLAAAFGAAGLLCQLIWPLFRTRRSMIAAQFGMAADYGTHYALLGAWSGAGVAGLGAAQSALAFLAGERPWLSRSGLAFLPIVAMLCLATWSGAPSLLALTAVTLIMVGRLQQDTLRLRVFLLTAAPFGMSHDILVGAVPALMGGMFSAVIAATMLAREIRERRATVRLAAGSK